MVEITWLGHATFSFRLDNGEVIVADPWVEGNPKHPEGHSFSRVDTILVTHGHFDHFAQVVDLARKFNSRVVGIYELCLFVQSKGIENIAAMNKGGSQQAGSVRVTMTHAFHSSSIDDNGRVVYAGEPAGYVIEFPDGRRAYFAGDTAVFGDMSLIAQLYQPELCFLPIGDLYTMGPKEAAVAARMLKPRKIIPMHWGTFPPLVGRPEELASLLGDLPSTEVWTLEPGRPVTW